MGWAKFALVGVDLILGITGFTLLWTVDWRISIGTLLVLISNDVFAVYRERTG